MARCKVKDEDLKELAELYNAQEKNAVYELLASRYDVKNPYFVLRRMRDCPKLEYDTKDEHGGTLLADDSAACHTQKEQTMDSRPAAMEKLIRELIGDRLLELNRLDNQHMIDVVYL